VNSSLLHYLERHQGRATFLFATQNANTAEPYILETGKPVMAMGGFLGSDPILTTAKLASLVKRGVVRYFLLPSASGFRLPNSLLTQVPKRFRSRLRRGDFFRGGRFGGNGDLTTWVQKHCTVVPPRVYGGTTTSTRSGGASSPSSSFGGFRGGFFGGQQLYNCSNLS